MTDDEKKRFFELAQKDAERYQAEVAAYGGEDVLKKKKRAKKDPNAPKRALYEFKYLNINNAKIFRSAFFFFSNEKRQEVSASHPEWKVGQIAQELGLRWKALPEEERQIFEKKAQEDKERYAVVNYKFEFNLNIENLRKCAPIGVRMPKLWEEGSNFSRDKPQLEKSNQSLGILSSRFGIYKI
jgi:hypothetical protein